MDDYSTATESTTTQSVNGSHAKTTKERVTNTATENNSNSSSLNVAEMETAANKKKYVKAIKRFKVTTSSNGKKYNTCLKGCSVKNTQLTSYLNKHQRLHGRVCVGCDRKLDKKSFDPQVLFCDFVNAKENAIDENKDGCEYVFCGACCINEASGKCQCKPTRFHNESPRK